MNIFNRIFRKTPTSQSELDFSAVTDVSHRSIIELDERIGKLCLWGENMDVLNDYQRNFFLNQSFERELNNGGFHQFFFNSTGKYSHETVGSLKAINAVDTAMLLEAAISKFPQAHVSADHNERRNVLEENDLEFDDLDDEFYRYTNNLTELTIDYIRQNISFF